MCFAVEASRDLGMRDQLGPQYLERQVPTQSQVMHAIHGPHAALAQQAIDAILTVDHRTEQALAQ